MDEQVFSTYTPNCMEKSIKDMPPMRNIKEKHSEGKKKLYCISSSSKMLLLHARLHKKVIHIRDH